MSTYNTFRKRTEDIRLVASQLSYAAARRMIREGGGEKGALRFLKLAPQECGVVRVRQNGWTVIVASVSRKCWSMTFVR